MTKVVRYELPLDSNVRARHFHQITKGRVEQFTIQLETFVKGKWVAVVRYDTAHGFAHRDLIYFNGRKEKKAIHLDFNEAITFADQDIRENWERYISNFLRESHEK